MHFEGRFASGTLASIMDQDPRTTAKTAREGLARGLGLLQDPNLPPAFMTAAEPIARAMGLLMQCEKSDGSPGAIRGVAEQALLAVRDALGRLQSIATSHPAAEQAMGTVAQSLGQVHGLTKLPDRAAPPFLSPTVPQGPPAAPGFAPPPPSYAQQQQPQSTAFQPPAQNPYQQQQQQQPQFQQPPAPQFQPPPQQQPWQPQQQTQQAPPPRAPATTTGGDSVPPPAGTIEAELGAHSPSNFYKTLSGNDIVDHGGIFVATYAIPKIGQRVMIRVHMPGGYNFDCAGLVKWTREARDNPDSPPGFGAQFHGMSVEQRGLVQRYVRNREPLFYDDL